MQTLFEYMFKFFRITFDFGDISISFFDIFVIGFLLRFFMFLITFNWGHGENKVSDENIQKVNVADNYIVDKSTGEILNP